MSIMSIFFLDIISVPESGHRLEDRARRWLNAFASPDVPPRTWNASRHEWICK